MLNQAMSLDGTTAIYANGFIKVYETGTSTIEQDFATKTELTNINTANASSTQANTDAIDILNTKQLQSFSNITAINTDLTNNYQTNTVLSSNFYTKSEVDTTFTNYYTSFSNYYTITQTQANYYDKTYIDANIGGGGRN